MSCIVTDSCLESLTLIATQHEDWIIQQAITLLERRIFKAGPCLSTPAAVRDYLRLKLVAEPNEVFSVVFMDSQHRMLAYEPLFKGSVDQTSVYPRVVVQRALALNASALILAHQHPSGVTEPSAADRPGDGRRSGVGSPHRGGGHAVLVCRSRAAVAAVCIPASEAISPNPAGAPAPASFRGGPKAEWLRCALFVANGSALAFD